MRVLLVTADVALKTCPLCCATLQRLTGADGWAVELTVDETTRRRVVERRIVTTVYACPVCEHVQ